MSKTGAELAFDKFEGAVGNLSPPTLSYAEINEILSDKYGIKPQTVSTFYEHLPLIFEHGPIPKWPSPFQFPQTSASASSSPEVNKVNSLLQQTALRLLVELVMNLRRQMKSHLYVLYVVKVSAWMFLLQMETGFKLMFSVTLKLECPFFIDLYT